LIRAAAAARERGEIGERGIGARQSNPAANTRARGPARRGRLVPLYRLGDIVDVVVAVEAEQAAKRNGRKAG
jgi:hypothetical protein